MAKLNHWVAELPEFGTTYTILSLIDEQNSIYKEIETLQKRALEINDEILSHVEKNWNRQEIETAKSKFYNPKKLFQTPEVA